MHSLGLSNALLQGLLGLGDKIRQLGVIYHPVRQEDIVQEILRSFITLWIKEFWDANTASNLHNIMLLHNISTNYGDAWNDVSSSISDTLESAVRFLTLDQYEPLNSILNLGFG